MAANKSEVVRVETKPQPGRVSFPGRRPPQGIRRGARSQQAMAEGGQPVAMPNICNRGSKKPALPELAIPVEANRGGFRPKDRVLGFRRRAWGIRRELREMPPFCDAERARDRQ